MNTTETTTATNTKKTKSTKNTKSTKKVDRESISYKYFTSPNAKKFWAAVGVAALTVTGFAVAKRED